MATNAVVKFNDVAQQDKLIQQISFMLADEAYGIEVLKAREIIRMPIITKMPNTPHYIEGVINLRGEIVPVIS
ncbi:MAG: chemotaxis protein CheW, partial [Kiritimatiellia bacterium]